MSAKKKNPNSRHGRLAEDRTQTSIRMKKELLAKCKAEAKKQNRSFANWLENLLTEKLPLIVIGALCATHVARTGLSDRALRATEMVKTGALAVGWVKARL